MAEAGTKKSAYKILFTQNSIDPFRTKLDEALKKINEGHTNKIKFRNKGNFKEAAHWMLSRDNVTKKQYAVLSDGKWKIDKTTFEKNKETLAKAIFAFFMSHDAAGNNQELFTGAGKGNSKKYTSLYGYLKQERWDDRKVKSYLKTSLPLESVESLANVVRLDKKDDGFSISQGALAQLHEIARESKLVIQEPRFVSRYLIKIMKKHENEGAFKAMYEKFKAPTNAGGGGGRRITEELIRQHSKTIQHRLFGYLDGRSVVSSPASYLINGQFIAHMDDLDSTELTEENVKTDQLQQLSPEQIESVDEDATTAEEGDEEGSLTVGDDDVKNEKVPGVGIRHVDSMLGANAAYYFQDLSDAKNKVESDGDSLQERSEIYRRLGAPRNFDVVEANDNYSVFKNGRNYIVSFSGFDASLSRPGDALSDLALATRIRLQGRAGLESSTRFKTDVQKIKTLLPAPTEIGSLHISGHSVGGCLAVSTVEKLKDEYIQKNPKIDIQSHTFDTYSPYFQNDANLIDDVRHVSYAFDGDTYSIPAIENNPEIKTVTNPFIQSRERKGSDAHAMENFIENENMLYIAQTNNGNFVEATSQMDEIEKLERGQSVFRYLSNEPMYRQRVAKETERERLLAGKGDGQEGAVEEDTGDETDVTDFYENEEEAETMEEEQTAAEAAAAADVGVGAAAAAPAAPNQQPPPYREPTEFEKRERAIFMNVPALGRNADPNSTFADVVHPRLQEAVNTQFHKYNQPYMEEWKDWHDTDGLEQTIKRCGGQDAHHCIELLIRTYGNLLPVQPFDSRKELREPMKFLSQLAFIVDHYKENIAQRLPAVMLMKLFKNSQGTDVTEMSDAEIFAKTKADGGRIEVADGATMKEVADGIRAMNRVSTNTAHASGAAARVAGATIASRFRLDKPDETFRSLDVDVPTKNNQEYSVSQNYFQDDNILSFNIVSD